MAIKREVSQSGQQALAAADYMYVFPKYKVSLRLHSIN